MPRLAVIALILGLLTGCSEPDDTLRIGANRWLGYAPIYLADDLGWMQQSHLRLVEYPHATGVLRGYRNGLLDAALLTLDEALILQSSGLPVQILLVADVSEGADVLFAKSTITRLEQLRGQRIGVENSALGAYFLSRILDLAKLDRADVQIFDMPINEHLKALQNGQIDAAINFASATQDFNRLGAPALLDSRAIPNEIIDVLVINPQNVDARQAAKLRALWFTSLEEWQQQRGTHDVRIERRLGLTASELEVTLAGLRLGNEAFNQELLREGQLNSSMQRLNEYLYRRQLQNKPATISQMLPRCESASC